PAGASSLQGGIRRTDPASPSLQPAAGLARQAGRLGEFANMSAPAQARARDRWKLAAAVLIALACSAGFVVSLNNVWEPLSARLTRAEVLPLLLAAVPAVAMMACSAASLSALACARTSTRGDL